MNTEQFQAQLDAALNRMAEKATLPPPPAPVVPVIKREQESFSDGLLRGLSEGLPYALVGAAIGGLIYVGIRSFTGPVGE